MRAGRLASPPGHEEHEQDEERAEQEERLGERDPEHVREILHSLGSRERAEPLVGERVEEAADHRAVPRPGPTEHDHHEQREREVGGRHLGGCAADQEEPHDSSQHSKERAEHERDQLERVRSQADHLDPRLVLPDRPPDVTGGRVDGEPDDDEHEHRVAEGEPVEVLRVEDADERVGDLVVVEPGPLLAPGPAVRVLLDEDVPGLRERQRDHREGDAADPKADGAEHERHGEADHEEEAERRPEPPLPPRQRDRGHVHAERDVEGVTERQETGEAEEHVVRQRDSREEEAEREHLQRPRAVERPAEDQRDLDGQLRHEREQHEDDDRDADAGDAPQCDTFGASPCGRTRSTAASRRTTARSPVPLDA